MSNILVIDDDQEILEVVEVLLSNKGLKVKTEPHWEKTFSEIESFEPDVILMDIGLGNGDGRTITRQIKSSDASRHIPVILVSGINGIHKNLSGCFNDDFMAKPFEEKVLVDKIQYHLYKKYTAKNIEEDYQAMRLMANAPYRLSNFLYDKYAAILFGYILSLMKDKKQSEKILIKIFTGLANDTEPLKRENILLKCIRTANKIILKRTGQERQSFLSFIDRDKQIQNN